jgi:two-component system, OmpR family, sensor histidine kinase VicK
VGTVPLLEGDEVKLSQVFSNVFSNALRFSPENGTIDISCSKEVEGVKISVADQGPGIPQQDLDKIFERFYKVDESRNRGNRGDGGTETGGSGLGLAISREIIHAHGGRIWAESDGSTGTTVSLFLPYRRVN